MRRGHAANSVGTTTGPKRFDCSQSSGTFLLSCRRCRYSPVAQPAYRMEKMGRLCVRSTNGVNGLYIGVYRVIVKCDSRTRQLPVFQTRLPNARRTHPPTKPTESENMRFFFFNSFRFSLVIRRHCRRSRINCTQIKWIL